MISGDDDITHAESTVLHKDVGNVTAALVERRLDNSTDGTTVGICFQIEHLSLEKYFLHKVVDADTLLGGYVLALVFATPLLDKVVHCGELFLDFVGIGMGLVNLVDSEDDRHTGCGSVVDSFDGLRHDAVVGSHDDYDKVGNLRTTGTHSGKRLVTGSIEEGYVAAIGELHIIGADVLGNTAGLTGDDISLTDVVEKRGLAVVDMTHDCNNRRTAHEVFLTILFLMNGVSHLGGYIFCGKTEFLGHDIDCLGIEALVDRHHHTDVHTCGDDVVYGLVHHGGQIVGRHKLGDFQNAAFSFLGLHSLTLACGIGLTFFLAPLGTALEFLVLGG